MTDGFGGSPPMVMMLVRMNNSVCVLFKYACSPNSSCVCYTHSKHIKSLVKKI